MLNKIIVFFAVYLPYFVIGMAFALLAFKFKLKVINLKKILTMFFIFFATLGCAWLVSHFLKNYFAMPRPFLSGAKHLFVEGGYDSFPSNHATFFSALATYMYIFHKKISWIFIVSAILIGIARVLAGVHYPIDILVGYFIGIVTALIIVHFCAKVSRIC